MDSGSTEIDSNTDEEPTTSTDYRTLSGDFNVNSVNDDYEETTITDFETLSTDFGADLDNDETATPLSEYRTPDIECQRNADYKCGFCVCNFGTLRECLRHEILEHPKLQRTAKVNQRTNQKHMMRLIKQSNTQSERERIHQLLQNCQTGSEMHELFKIYCIDDRKLKDISDMVTASLLNQLQTLRNVKVYTFGSMNNGLMMWDSDIDLYVSTYNNGMNFPDERTSKKLFQQINSLLRRKNTSFDEVTSLSRARVPLIKCRHLRSGMRVDINCSCPNSMVSTQFVQAVMRFDVRLHSLMRFLKIWAKQVRLIGQTQMSSYCLTTLVLFFLQQPSSCGRVLLPSIQQLQRDVKPNLMQGINYAFKVRDIMHPLPPDLITSALVRKFFFFYEKFDFKNFMIVPYLGVPVPITDFTAKNSEFYTLYQTQMTVIEAAGGKARLREPLAVDRGMVVIDPFLLNQNIARSVMPPHLNYFSKCIQYGYNICTNSEILVDKQLLEALLFDTIASIENEAQQLQKCVGNASSQSHMDELRFSFTLSRSEMHALTVHQLKYSLDTDTAKPSIYWQYVHHYINVIHEILVQIYLLDVKNLKNQNAVHSEAQQLTVKSAFMEELKQNGELTWLLTGKLDTWSGRNFQRTGSQTFFDYQIVQTKQFLDERKKKSSFQVNIIGEFLIKVPSDYKSIELTLKHVSTQSPKCFTKKDPLRKFFTNFKCSMQNFNLKERLQSEREHTNNNPQFDTETAETTIHAAKNSKQKDNQND